MEEYSRIIIEQYCRTHNSKRSRTLARLVKMSYDVSAIADDCDAIELEKAINATKDEELREALIELDEYLFG